jgi:hypothetical protein
MAAFMSSAFTAPDRRKKVVTYGKSSRLPSIPTPAPSIDAPSPERPRKQSTVTHASLKNTGGTTGNGKLGNASRDSAASLDIFDVPSEDEFAAHAPIIAKKPITKRRTPETQTRASVSNGGAKQAGGKAEKVVGKSRDLEAAKAPATSKAKAVSTTTQPAKAPPVSTKGSQPPIVPRGGRGKTPQPITDVEQDAGDKQPEKRPIARVKTVTQVTASAAPPLRVQKVVKSNVQLPVKDALVKSKNKAAPSLDIFDMPSSDDESLMPTPKPTRRAAPVARKAPLTATTPALVGKGKDDIESDDSMAAKKRKRRGSVPSVAAVKRTGVAKAEPSLPQRSVKHQKRDGTMAPRHESLKATTTTAQETQSAASIINKPRRTRVRTVPVMQPASTKSQSSPATLQNMVPNDRVSKPSPITEVLEPTVLEDDTMYEIPNSFATPVRPSPHPMSGSITPRQKALFGSLLGTSSATPSMPSISRLQLTDSKPRSLLGALAKSKSDLTPSAQTSKTRLIASLTHTDSSSDEDVSDDDSEAASDAALEAHAVRQKKPHKPTNHTAVSCNTSELNDMNLDAETAADTQTSQTTSGFGSRAKNTYAKQRSYLQEQNPEDELMMSMDMDDPLTSGSQTRDSQTEDEEEASQARGMHELRRQGQNHKFELEVSMLTDDMFPKCTPSIRRAALLELCTKMADATFTHELMDSSLAQQFLKNLVSNGEIIFDFATAVAIVFILRAKPAYTVLDELRRPELLSTLAKLLEHDLDVQKIAKNRKTNLSRLAHDATILLRSTLLASNVWSSIKPETVSPQLVTLKALDLLVLGLREVGSVDPIITADTLGKLVDIAYSVSERYSNGKCDDNDETVLHTTLSIMEATSLANKNSVAWSASMMQHLASAMACVFQIGHAPMVTMAVKLCMNLTNNKPKACQQFSGSPFVQSLVQSIISRWKLLQDGIEEAQRTEALDTLILSLGAMINLTEHSDQARLNADNGQRLLETLVDTFVEGSAKTTQVSFDRCTFQKSSTDSIQAISMEESQSSVAIGYLSVLLGNLCLNESIRTRVREQLPDRRLTALVDKVKEFVRVHEHANRKAKQYEGEEGQETWRNYTARIMLVVKQLEMAEN